jgi:hypothetical protein
MKISPKQWKKIVAVNIGAAIGIVGALLLLPATAVGSPLLFSSIGFWGLVNFITVPNILEMRNGAPAPKTATQWRAILIWICLILGIILISSARR